MHPAAQVAAALIPSIGVGAVFWFAMRAIIQADRRERQAVARLDAEARKSDAAKD
ncbi:hypothetical protein ICW40_08455 [Actinotalea ferrariae]|uniref:hypothetical protein n=1 Tax=Actinotalea ferrariae TaxID=1386098 RepID=UPI001C8C913F|nr:hypothetical protein [Actinotalea ferrariae]MBX9244841.1 hypothetical protein [Actinotalea ferrariae]